MEVVEDEVIDQIRVNIAFEQMIVAVLAGAAVGGALTLVSKVAAVFMLDFSFAALLTAALETLLVTFLIFLIGFAASVAVGAPLFIFLEKRKRRNTWPYLAASIAIALAVFVAVAGGLPGVGRLTFGALASTLAPAIVIALIFGRLMQPHWRAAERAEEKKPFYIRLN